MQAAALPRRFEPLLLTFLAAPTLEEDGIVLGDDNGTRLILDPETRAIESIDPDGALPDRFINSSIGQLARCIVAYAAYVKNVQSAADDSAVTTAVRRLHGELKTIDAPCIANPENWWSVVLEQVENRFL